MILDTSVLIDILRGEDLVTPWEEKLDETGAASITPITVMELWEGIHRASATRSERDDVETLLTEIDEVPFDTPAAVRAGEISATLLDGGNRIDVEDIMIGAIAVERDETVLTGNPKHFDRIPDLTVESY